ncbi:hypothetical protein BACPU_13900 [Bacillus pumilus]|nr:hypothetical protein BACPU_13900 [Bacillus pumilus]
MSKKHFVEKITSIEDDFAHWYTDVVTKARLVDYSSVRGSMIIQPYGFKIWENIRDELDRQIKPRKPSPAKKGSYRRLCA